ncbi:MAG: hypothetical protein P1V36_16090 [Planctomycetota bacterium]|nr:hypothetical protein [Planctomycetota bacterium]
MRFQIRALLLLVLPLLAAALAAGCGSSSGGGTGASLPPIGMRAPVIAGAEGTVEDGGGVFVVNPQLHVGDSAANQRLVGVVAFDLTGVTQVLQAELTLHRTANIGNALDLQPLNLDHIDGGGVLDAADLTGAALTASVHVLTDQVSWTLDVTPQVAADLAAGRSESTFRLRLDGATDADGALDHYRIGSSKHVNMDVHPVLELTIPP